MAVALVFLPPLQNAKTCEMNMEHPPLFSELEVPMPYEAGELSRCREAQEKFAQNLGGKITETQASFSEKWGYVLRSKIWVDARSGKRGFDTHLLCWQRAGSSIVNLYTE